MTKEARRLKYAVEMLGLWLEPLKISCTASAHNGPGVAGCTCRTVKIRVRTRQFLAGIREPHESIQR
jgi:hypothetical protein